MSIFGFTIAWAHEPADTLPFDPPYVDDPDWLIGRCVSYGGRLYWVEGWKFSLGDTWLHLIPEKGWRCVWALADDVTLGRE